MIDHDAQAMLGRFLLQRPDDGIRRQCRCTRRGSTRRGDRWGTRARSFTHLLQPEEHDVGTLHMQPTQDVAVSSELRTAHAQTSTEMLRMGCGAPLC